MIPKIRSTLMSSLWCTAWLLITCTILLTHPQVRCHSLIISITIKLHHTLKQTAFHRACPHWLVKSQLQHLNWSCGRSPPQNIPMKQHQPGSVDRNLGGSPLYSQPLSTRNWQLYWQPCTYLHRDSSSKPRWPPQQQGYKGLAPCKSCCNHLSTLTYLPTAIIPEDQLQTSHPMATGQRDHSVHHLQYPSPLCRLTWAVTHMIGLHIKLTILRECDVASGIDNYFRYANI